MRPPYLGEVYPSSSKVSPNSHDQSSYISRLIPHLGRKPLDSVKENGLEYSLHPASGRGLFCVHISIASWLVKYGIGSTGRFDITSWKTGAKRHRWSISQVLHQLWLTTDVKKTLFYSFTVDDQWGVDKARSGMIPTKWCDSACWSILKYSYVIVSMMCCRETKKVITRLLGVRRLVNQAFIPPSHEMRTERTRRETLKRAMHA